MSSSRVAAASVLLVLLAVGSVGCAPDPAGDPTAAPSPSAPSDTPTPTPEPTRPALTELVLTPQGIGDIRIGAPVPSGDPALSIVEFDATACTDLGYAEGEPWAGYWRSVDIGSPHDYGGPEAFFLRTEGGVQGAPVTFVRVHSDVRTAEGIGIGSTRAEVEAAYPAPTEIVDRFGISTVYALAEGDVRVTIEVANEDTDGYWPTHVAGRVLAMWAETTEHSAYGIAGGDGGGPCPL